ncbi:hypothetical protein MBLNU230_g0796t1 [Neophaeotheca triangularis]
MHHLHHSPVSLASLLLASFPAAQSFYLPGITPTNYKEGDAVSLNVNHLTPSPNQRDNQIRSAFSFDYYHNAFHHCPPKGGSQYLSESLGSILFGDRIQTSPFELHMNKNETCRAACEEVVFEPRDAKFVNRRIQQGYNINWIVDGLPAGEHWIDSVTGEDLYQPGFALGSIKGDLPQLHNHFNIMIDYHRAARNQYRVVGITVTPQSRQDAKKKGKGDDMSAECGSVDSSPVVLSEQENTKVTYTYSVGWRPSRTSFATRWDKYLHVYNPEIHWFWLIGSAAMVTMLIGMVSTIMVRTLKKDIQRYNRLDEYDLDDLGQGNGSIEDGVQEDSGWKLVHGDVFRPPRNSLLLAVLVGNGAQLFAMVGFTILFASIGFLSPSNRGSLATVMILLYTIFGSISGYTSSRVYKSFLAGSPSSSTTAASWKLLFILTPSALPAFVFSVFFLLNLFVWVRGSSGAVPFTTMLALIAIWFLISVPLSLAGSWLGFRQTFPDPPVRTNQIPRQIPPTPAHQRTLPTAAAVGLLPFAAIFLQLFFIMRSLWSSRIYYMFGFLFLCYGLMIVTTAAVTVIAVYMFLCQENYHWQWRAFICSGASAGYVFAYSLLYWARMLSFSSWTGGLLYLGYSALAAVLWFVLSGTIGFLACWLFTWKIYGSLKVD